MRAIHFICKRDDGVSLNNLTFEKATQTYRSGYWDISVDEAIAVVGGWIYLHPAKSSLSEFGGIVQGYEPVVDASLAHANRIVLLVKASLSARGQPWRGQAHGMAHSSGLVEASFPHEVEIGKT